MKRYPSASFVMTPLGSLLAACLLLCGCSSIKVVETWNKPASAGHHYRKLAIIGISEDKGLRDMAENILVDEMGRKGVTAVAGHTLVGDIHKVKREEIVAAVRSAGADAVLTIRAIAKGDTTVTQEGKSGGVYGTATNVGGSYVPSARGYSLATLLSNLYDSTTEELVWSATISTYDAENEARVSRDLARFFVKRLREDGLLGP